MTAKAPFPLPAISDPDLELIPIEERSAWARFRAGLNLTIDEVARILRVEPGRAYSLAGDGCLAAYKVGRGRNAKWLIPAAGLRGYIESR